MKNIWLLLLISIGAFSQERKTDSFIGKWNVVEILTETPKQGTNQVPEIARIFLNSIFHFNENGEFELAVQSSSPFAIELKKMTAGAKWKYISKSDTIKIGNIENNYSIMSIQLLNNKNGYFLKFLETGLMVKVLKI